MFPALAGRGAADHKYAFQIKTNDRPQSLHLRICFMQRDSHRKGEQHTQAKVRSLNTTQFINILFCNGVAMNRVTTAVQRYEVVSGN